MKPSSTSVQYTSLGITFVLTILLFWYVGTKIDAHFKTRIFQLIGIFLALGGMTYKLILVVKKSDESQSN